MHDSFVQRVADPDHPDLQELAATAREGVRDTLADWGWTDVDDGVVRNLSYTYYHDWARNDPDLALLVQDPGPLYDRHRSEVEAFREAGPDATPRELVALHRRYATSWLVERNADFTAKFLRVCDDHGLVDVGASWEAYVRSGDIFEDFYVGDVIKHRTDDHGDRHYRAAYDAFLREELTELDPEVLFVFGGSAWDTVRSQATLRPPAGLDVDSSKITAVHGYPFEATAPTDTTVVPLVHFSGRIYHSLLRDSYVEYLDEGLATL